MKKLAKKILYHEYKTAYRIIADQLSFYAGRLINRKVQFTVWMLAATLIPLTALTGYLISSKTGHEAITQPIIFAPFVISTIYVSLLIIVCENVINHVLNIFGSTILTDISSPADQRNFEQRLNAIFSMKRQIVFGLAFSLIVHFIFILPEPNLIKLYGWSLITANIIINFFHGICVYFVFSFAQWMYQDLPNYNFDLYAIDPSSSNAIQVLFRCFNYILYNILIMITIVSITLGLFNVFPKISFIISIVLMWGIASFIFFSNVGVLSSIIRKSKQKTLNEIQFQIKELQIKEKIPSQETLEHLTKLVEYHNKIKSSPDSPLNFRSFMEFFSSLLLPTIGLIITNLKNVLSIYKDFWP